MKLVKHGYEYIVGCSVFIGSGNNISHDDHKLITSAIRNSVERKILTKIDSDFYIGNENFNNLRKCQIVYVTIDINNESHYKKLINDIPLIIKNCHKKIQTIPDSNGIYGGHFGLFNENSTNEITITNSILQQMTYDESKRNVLYIVSQIIFKINASHLYCNGNKRTSLISAFSILYYFDFHVLNTPTEMLKQWEDIITNVANYKQLDFLKSEEKTIKYIKKNIKRIIMLRRYEKAW